MYKRGTFPNMLGRSLLFFMVVPLNPSAWDLKHEPEEVSGDLFWARNIYQGKE